MHACMLPIGKRTTPGMLCYSRRSETTFGCDRVRRWLQDGKDDARRGLAEGRRRKLVELEERSALRAQAEPASSPYIIALPARARTHTAPCSTHAQPRRAVLAAVCTATRSAAALAVR